MATEQDTTAEGQEVEAPIVPGLPFTKPEEIAKHISSQKEMIDRHGNEVGTLRKQLEFTQQMIDKLSQSQKQEVVKEQGPDYDAEIGTIYKQIEELDPLADGYQKQVVKLIAKSNDLTAKAQHSRTLQAASDQFRKELEDRDIKSAHKEFYKNNPDFATPEMQMAIRDEVAKDPTGMLDPMAAYLKIQRDQTAAEKSKLAEELAEAKRLLELKKGAESTGKVMTKNQQSQQPTKQTKATGKALDEGMRDALRQYREKASG